MAIGNSASMARNSSTWRSVSILGFAMLFETMMIFTHSPFKEVPGMQRFNALFKENAELVTLSERANNLTASQKIWNSAVPDALRPFTRAGAVKHKRLTVYADNGAVA